MKTTTTINTTQHGILSLNLSLLLLATAIAACSTDEGASAGAGGNGEPDTGSIVDKDTANSKDSIQPQKDAVSTPHQDASEASGDSGATSDGSGNSTSDAGKSLRWYKTCGAPVCREGWKRTPKVPLCVKGEQRGQSCTAEGTTCDNKDGCSVFLLCAKEDPKLNPGGCPISQRRYKKEIHYLNADEEARFAAELQRLPLTTWRYKQGDARRRLGFILEDAPQSIARDGRRGQVDLYSYASLAVAALKVQRRELDALKAELRALKLQLSTSSRCTRKSHGSIDDLH